MIEFVAASQNTDLFLAMYHQYLLDLGEYDQEIAQSEKSETIDNIITNNYLKCKTVNSYFIVADDKYVGFIVIEHVDEKYEIIPPLWYIVEFFVSPEYRRKAIGTNAVKHFLDKYDGDFFYYVIRKNEPAIRFWKQITQKFNLKEVDRPDLYDGDPKTTIHAFERS